MEEVIQCMKEKKNLFITGPGGHGKTYLSNKIFSEFSRIYNFLKCAPTGVAALHIQGSTIHSLFKIPPDFKNCKEKIILELKKNKKFIDKIKIATHLYIDEISMLDSDLFEFMELILRTLRNEKNELWGGLNIIACGDFYQLPPVNADYVFVSEIWKKTQFAIIQLKTPYRFDDLRYAQLLSRLRVGSLNEEDKKLLLERLNKEKELDSKIKPTRLYSKRLDVASYNEKELNLLNSKEYIYKSEDSYKNSKSEILKKQVDQSIPEFIKLKVNAQVMINTNLSMLGLVNGSRAIVRECHDDYVIVDTDEESNIQIDYVTREFIVDDLRMTRTYIPLILAWALTIHKTQGSTISKIVVNLGEDMFVQDGMFYVALSRTPSFQSLFIESISFKNVKTNEKVKKFYCD